MAWFPQSHGRGTAVRPRQANRPVYEDFQPETETNEADGARIVIIRAPGFLKEQLRITAEHGNNIRVQGQRPLANNRWSRFNKLIPIPQNCDVNKIHAKFHEGILTINLPKEVPKTAPAPMPPIKKKPEEKTTPENINKFVPPKATESEVIPPPGSESTQKAVTAADQREQQKGQEQAKDARNVDAEQTSQKTAFAEEVEKAQGKTPQTVTSVADYNDEKPMYEKKKARSWSPQKKSIGPKRQEAVEEETLVKQREIGDKKEVVASADPQKYKSEPKSKRVQEETPVKQRDDGTKKSANERPKEEEKTEKIAERSLEKEKEKEKENTHKGKEPLGDGEKAAGKFSSGASVEEKPKKDDGEKSTNGNKLGIKYAVEAAKQTLTGGVRKLNDDDRQMLINIGAAVLVIVAIGAYVSHRFVSSAKREN